MLPFRDGGTYILGIHMSELIEACGWSAVSFLESAAEAADQGMTNNGQDQ